MTREISKATEEILSALRIKDETNDEVIQRLVSEKFDREQQEYDAEMIKDQEETTKAICLPAFNNLEQCATILDDYFDEDLERYEGVTDLLVEIVEEWIELKESWNEKDN